MGEKVTEVRDYCDECGGEGDVSGCCSAEVDDGRCVNCSRFCYTDPCHNCEGAGHVDYHIGDEVDIFLCVWSEQYLTDQFKDLKIFGRLPKEVGDSRIFTGNLIEFTDRWNVIVKIGKKKINVKLEDISTR